MTPAEEQLRSQLDAANREIAELRARVRGLKEALKPFAYLGPYLQDGESLDPKEMFRLVIDDNDADLLGRDILRARAEFEKDDANG
jgi:hypothetical protein